MNVPRTLLILCLLEQLHAARPLKLRQVDLELGLVARGYLAEARDKATAAADTKELLSVLTDMHEQGFITITADKLDASVKRFDRTEAGRVQLVENGLA